MATTRVQFSVSPEDGEDVFDRFATKVKHRQWIHVEGKGASWTRAALRILAAHATRGVGVQWVLVKGQKIGEPLSATEPAGATVLKVDVILSERDAALVRAIEKAEVASGAPAVLRASVHLLATIAKALRTGHELQARTHGRARALVDLAGIVSEEESGPDEDEMLLPLQGDGSVPPSQSERHPSAEADEFFSVLWCTITLNRWLTLQVDAVTRDAQTTWRRGTEKEREDDPKLAEKLADWERRLDIRRLFEEFWHEEQAKFRSGEGNHLTSEFREQKLLPESWRKTVAPDQIEAKARFGIEVLRAFLRHRFEVLHPWRITPSQWARAETGPLESLPLILWRNWTRSRFVDGYREVNAPIEWTTVLHHMLSQRSGNPAMVAHDLQTLLINAFGVRNSRLFLDLAASCRRFNEAFYGSAVVSGDRALIESGTTLTIEKCLEILEGEKLAVSDSSESHRKALAEEQRTRAIFTYLFLNIARVVRAVYRWEGSEFGVDDEPLNDFAEIEVGVRSLAYADLSELRARVFGAQTTINGLHWILHGGIIPRARKGRVWLVHGRPGCGKSTLALALAADMATRGRIAVVVCADERVDIVMDRLITFGLRNDRRYDVVTSDEFEQILQTGERPTTAGRDAKAPVKGLLVVFGASAKVSPQFELLRYMRRVSDAATALYERCREEEQQRRNDLVRVSRLRDEQRLWRWIAIVIDSIDSLEVESPKLLGAPKQSRDERPLMAKLVQSIEACRMWGVLLCGEDNPRRLPLTYLADTVIEVGTDATGMQRQLQISKCRIQRFDPGHHDFQIVEGSGIVIHPNLSSIQRAVVRHTRRSLDSAHVVRIPRRICWPGVIEPAAEVSSNTDLPCVKRGSAILLYGPPQSGKGPLLLNLMSQRMELERFPKWRLGATGAALVVSLRSSTQDCLRPLAESPVLGAKWQTNVSDVQLQWYGADNTMRAAQIAYELVRRIQRARRDGVPFDWIVFMGIEALRTNLPLVDAERSFWPTILAITASEEITTAFVVARTDHDFVAAHGQDMDYVLRFGREDKSDVRTIQIEKSAEPPPPGGYPHLLLNLRAGTISDDPPLRD